MKDTNTNKDPISKKWIVKNGFKSETFDNFINAVVYFKKLIFDHCVEHCSDYNNDYVVYDCCLVPENVAAFFSSRFDDLTITDKELILRSRLDMLLQTALGEKDIEKAKNNTLMSINKSIHYSSQNEANVDIDVELSKAKNELIVNIICDYCNDTSFKTNAFIFDDSDKAYYFLSHQYTISSSDPNKLGTKVDAEIFLTKIDS